jgi:hypothetical protein
MKRIIILLILAVLFISGLAQEQMNNKLKLIGNLKIDSRTIQNEITFNPKLNLIQEENKKSPFLAAVFSLVIPGSGEFYAESYLKSAIFLLIEASAITADIIWTKKGDNLTQDFKNYADAHWSPVRYSEWLNTYSEQLGAENAPHIDIDPNTSKLPWNRVNFNQINQVEELVPTFSHRLIPYGEQQYYEVIGKYKQFNHGWDQSDPNTPLYLDNVPQQMFDYSAMFTKPDETFYKYASTAAVVLVVNHVLSALDAAWSVSRYNKNLTANLEIKRFDYLYAVDYYPQLNVKIQF